MYLGIDTSCYTTSVALVDKQEKLVWNKKILLPVPVGTKGFSQSEALFYHLKKLPELLEEVGQLFSYSQVKAVCASTKPRPLDESYMPVFIVSEKFGKIIAATLGIPFIPCSHQENHLRAGLWSANLTTEKFLSIHLSGGTTELLKVAWNGRSFNIELLGGTLDIHAGQFIDRIGVELGLPFPSGPYLQKLAEKSQMSFGIPSYVKNYSISFSGPEAAALRLIKSGKQPADIARSVENCIAKTTEKLILNAIDKEGIKEILFVGGVASNLYIRQRLRKRLEHKAVGGKLFFAAGEYSTDNAIGTALIAKDMQS